MLTLKCPFTGAMLDETELHCGGEAHRKRFGPGSSDDEFETYMFTRENPRGVHFELWLHAYGTGKWFVAARDTETMEVYGTYPAQTTEPPQDIKDAITAKRPGWMWREFE